MGSLLNESIENNLQEGANYEEEIEASIGVDHVFPGLLVKTLHYWK